MRRSTLFATALAFGLPVCGLLASARVTAEPQPVRVAVVDVFKVMQDAPKKRTIEQQRMEQKQAVDKYQEGEQARLQQLRGELMSLAKFSPQRTTKEEEFIRQSAAAETEVKLRVARAEKAYTDAVEQFYAEVRATIRAVAQEAGYQLVINKTEDALNLDRPGDFVLNVAVRSVLYSTPTIDITDAVSARLAQATRPPAPASPPAGTPSGSRPPTPASPPPSLPPPSAPPSGPSTVPNPQTPPQPPAMGR
jgi:Skp family chaperone for outer membrane proteins